MGLLYLALAAAVLLAAFIWLSAALYLMLLSELSAPLAALLTAGTILLVAVVLALIGRGYLRRSTRVDSRTGTVREPDQDIIALARDAGEASGHILQDHKLAAMGIVFAAGLAVGVSPRLRRSLRQLLD